MANGQDKDVPSKIMDIESDNLKKTKIPKKLFSDVPSVHYEGNDMVNMEHIELMHNVKKLVEDAFEKANKDQVLSPPERTRISNNQEIYKDEYQHKSKSPKGKHFDPDVTISPSSVTSEFRYSQDVSGAKKQGRLQKYSKKGLGSQSLYNLYSMSRVKLPSEKSLQFNNYLDDEGLYHTECEDYMTLLTADNQSKMKVSSKISLSDVSSSTLSCDNEMVERTIIVVKPEAVHFKAAIFKALLDRGFQILAIRILQLTSEQAAEIYAHKYGTIDLPYLVISVSSGPSIVIYVAARNAVYRLNQMLTPSGTLNEAWFYPFSIRKLFGLQKGMDDALMTSENHRNAKRQGRYFYPNQIVDPFKHSYEEVVDYCGLYINEILSAGLTELVKNKPEEPILFLAEWLLKNNPYQPTFPPKIAVIPT